MSQQPEPRETSRSLFRRPANFVLYLLRLWIGLMHRFAWPVLIGAVVLTAGIVNYTASHLSMQSDTREMLSSRLEWRKHSNRFDEALPHLVRTIAIVVTGPNLDLTRDGAVALARRLRAEKGAFNFVLYAPDEPFFRKNGILFLDVDELDKLSARLADAQGLLGALVRDMSLRGLADVLSTASREVAKGETDPVPLAPVFERLSDTLEARLAGRDRFLSWRELLTGDSVKPGDRREIIVAQPSPDYGSLTPASEAFGIIRGAASELGLDAAHGYRVRLTGSLALQHEELESVRRSTGIAGLISLVLVGMVVFAALRSGRLVFSTIAVLLIGLAWTAGFAALAVGHLNIISVAFAVLFLGLGVDFGIQLSLRYRECIDNGVDNDTALEEAGVGVGKAMIISTTTSAIGFFAFVPTDYVGMAELGIIAGGGIVIALFLYMTLLPALMSRMPLKRRSALAGDHGLARMGSWIGRHHRTVVVVSTLIGLAGAASIPLLRFDFDPIKLRDPSTESVRTYIELAGDRDASLYIGGVLASNAAAADRLAIRLERLREVDHVVTLNSFVPKRQPDKLDIIDGMTVFLAPVFDQDGRDPLPTADQRRAALARLRDDLRRLAATPASGPTAAPARRLAGLLDRVVASGTSDEILISMERALLATLPNRLAELREALEADKVTAANLPDVMRGRLVARDGTVRIAVHPSEDLSDREALRRFVLATERVAPNITDQPIVMYKAGESVVLAFQQAGAIAAILIIVALVVILRNLVDAALVLAPVILAAMLTLAATVVFNIPFNFANVIAIPLLLALGVDFGVHLVLRYRETRSVTELLRTSTPRAVLYSGLTTMCSFGSLVVSTHRGTASMGLLLLISLTLALLCALIVFPALLAWRERLNDAVGATEG